jgi:hypothetical protein
MKAIRAAICILIVGLTGACTNVGPEAYRSDQEKRPHYGYQAPMVRLLTI